MASACSATPTGQSRPRWARCWPSSASRATSASCRISSPAGSSSGWPWPAHQAPRAPLRRAAVQPRRAAARADARGDPAPAEGSRHHRGLRDPRSGGSHGHLRPDRRDAPGRHRPGGQRGDALPSARVRVRGPVHRPDQSLAWARDRRRRPWDRGGGPGSPPSRGHRQRAARGRGQRHPRRPPGSRHHLAREHRPSGHGPLPDFPRGKGGVPGARGDRDAAGHGVWRGHLGHVRSRGYGGARAAVRRSLRARHVGVRPVALVLAVLTLPLLAQGPVVHGADSVFTDPELGIVWGVLKNEAEERTMVVIRVSNPAGRYAYMTVEGVDPFTQRRVALVDGLPLGASIDIRTPRASFADLPRREIHLYASAADWRTGRSGLTVYYLGVPDTTPEFTTEAALESYLARPRSPGR